jgi:sulfite exporter TauE/SafE
MFKKNNLLLGMLYGLVPPAFAWLVFNYTLHNEAIIMDKPAAPYLLAIGLNLLLLRYYARNYLDKTSNGIMISTFVCMLLVFILKMHIR